MTGQVYQQDRYRSVTPQKKIEKICEVEKDWLQGVVTDMQARGKAPVGAKSRPVGEMMDAQAANSNQAVPGKDDQGKTGERISGKGSLPVSLNRVQP
jgi:hypothetical protein